MLGHHGQGPWATGLQSVRWKIPAEREAYANGWYQVDRDPDAFAERALAVVRKGYGAMKFDPFGTAFERILA